MMNWKETLVLQITFEEALEKISITHMEDFFPDVIKNQYNTDKKCYTQTVTVGKKMLDFNLYEKEHTIATQNSRNVYASNIRNKVSVLIVFSLEKINDKQTLFTYEGIVKQIDDSKTIKLAFATMKKQLHKRLVENPINLLKSIY